MRLGTLVIAAALGTSAWAAEANRMKTSDVTLCMDAIPGASQRWPVEMMTSKIFSAIGVKLDWRNGSCPAAPNAIKIAFAMQAPAGFSPGALAYARPYEGIHIVVFYDRVRRMHPSRIDQFMAYVLAHEIAHILEGVSRHSTKGIMKANWDGLDGFQIVCDSLLFADEDVELIRNGLRSRGVTLPAGGAVQIAGR